VRKRDRKALERYIRTTADEMGLRDWRISLSRKPADGSANAAIWLRTNHKEAVIYVAADFRDHAPDEQRCSIVHELIHCHLEPPTKLLTGDLRQHLGDSGSLFIEAFINAIEYGVDGLATAIAPRLPLIDWPE
jgi:hypothetical protein